MSNRLTTITHRGCPILISDYSNLSAPEEWKALMLAEHELMAVQPLGSVRSLSIMTGSRMSPEVTHAMKAVTQRNKPYIKVCAMVGLNGLQRTILIKAVEREAARIWGAFDTAAEALDWLAAPE